MTGDQITLYGLVILAIHLLGITTAVHAVMNVRTALNPLPSLAMRRI
ncbi:hypothetical protein OAF58_00405 [bacterium]|nr:hypothetical protein [bacterium]